MEKKIVFGILFCVLLLESFLDLKKREISLRLCLLGIVLRVLFLIFYQDISWGNALLGSTLGLCFFGISFLTREKIGYGDGFMVLLTGFYLGLFAMIRLLLYSFIILFLVSVLLYVVVKNKKEIRIPYIPFLFLGLFLEALL
ncbi:MAG TPA: prepilin peptidase [Lachnospiraceae bacterium]